MTYLLLCALAFSIVSVEFTEYRTLTIIALLNYLISVNVQSYDTMIIIVSIITFLGASRLVKFHTFHGYYQSSMLLGMLSCYAMLCFDMAMNNGHYLIYNNFEATIYVLVFSQFLIIYKSIWSNVVHIFTSCFTGMVDN